ncbi:hypothetical protein Taro_001093, partial [Colocasia esculenta]|nr:hypothetical protein [Colocasia esculenta]
SLRGPPGCLRLRLFFPLSIITRRVTSRVFRILMDHKIEMVDRRDWGGGGDDSEESTQHMIERIWESLTDIQRRMDQQAPVPPVAVTPGDGETVPIVPVPPPPGVEVPFVAPLPPPPPPMLLAEEPVMQFPIEPVTSEAHPYPHRWERGGLFSTVVQFRTVS